MNQTNPSQTKRRYRINPVEIGIFGVACLIVTHSLYQLISEAPDFYPAALAPMASRPTYPLQGDGARAVASAAGSSAVQSSAVMSNVTVTCGAPPTEQAISADKIRLTGSLCPSGTDAKLSKVVVQNSLNHYTATVFSDDKSSRFTTDYIPLEAGRNPLSVEFRYDDGKTASQSLFIQRN